MKTIDMLGQRCHGWTVIGKAPSRNANAWWRVRCDCGRERVARGVELRSGECRACHNADEAPVALAVCTTLLWGEHECRNPRAGHTVHLFDIRRKDPLASRDGIVLDSAWRRMAANAITLKPASAGAECLAAVLERINPSEGATQ